MDNTRIGENKQPTTQIVHGSDNVVDRLVQFMQKAHRINICVDSTWPLFAIEFKQIRDAFIDAKRRGVAVRYITEITKNNVSHCKELMSVVELRHLDGIKGNFYVTEDEYVACSLLPVKYCKDEPKLSSGTTRRSASIPLFSRTNVFVVPLPKTSYISGIDTK